MNCIWCAPIRMSLQREKVLRVSQLDATELDNDLLAVLQEQLLAVFKVLPSNRLLQFKPELRAAHRTLLWWCSVRASGQTFGQGMLDVQYSTGDALGKPPSLHRKLTLLLLSVSVEWLRERLHAVAPLLAPGLSPRHLEAVLGYLSAAVNALSLLNFTVFLLRGSYPTIQERLLGLLLVPSKPQILRNMNYDYMNREILWHGFSEFLFFILPHFNMFVIRNWLRRLVQTPSSSSPQTDRSHCVFCEKSATQPQVSPCGHVYCHYCLRANCMADSRFPCTVCGQIVTPHRT